MKNKKILVIGGAGYIGSQVVHDLIKSDYTNIAVVDDLSTGFRNAIPENVLFFKEDIVNSEGINYIFKEIKPDVVIHLAAKKSVAESMSNPEKYMTNNISGTINILNAMCKVGCKNIIFSSSAAVYGKTENIVFESVSTNPINVYGYTKLAIEEILNWYDATKGIKSVCLRYFNASGYDTSRECFLDKDPQNVMPILMETFLGKRKVFSIYGNDYKTDDGTCVRDYIHVKDLSIAHIKSLEYLLLNNESTILNLGTSKGSSVKQLIDISKEISKKDIKVNIAPRRVGDPAILIADYTKAHELLNWEPTYTIEDIVKSMLIAYKIIQ